MWPITTAMGTLVFRRRLRHFIATIPPPNIARIPKASRRSNGYGPNPPGPRRQAYLTLRDGFSLHTEREQQNPGYFLFDGRSKTHGGNHFLRRRL